MNHAHYRSTMATSFVTSGLSAFQEMAAEAGRRRWLELQASLEEARNHGACETVVCGCHSKPFRQLVRMEQASASLSYRA